MLGLSDSMDQFSVNNSGRSLGFSIEFQSPLSLNINGEKAGLKMLRAGQERIKAL